MGNASKEAFKPLTKGPGKEYARSMARWFVFVLRLYQMQVCQNQTWYQMTFTDEQLDVHAFWVAYNEETFAHLEKDNFDDPTTRFAALICLRPDGTFETPRNASHLLVQIKYFIRAGLLMWAHMRALSSGKRLSYYTNSFLPSLHRDAETPFGHICDAVGLATKYASTSAHAPNVSWSGDDSLSVEGYTVYWPKLVDALHDLLASTENLLLTGVFKSLDPVGDLGLELTPETTIKDVLSETGNRYSCFTNPANGYGHLEGRLASTFFTKLSGYLTKGVHKNAEGKEVITWDLKEAERWLDIYDECVQRLCLLTTMLGGQPARGTKITSMKLVNSAHRVRGVYVLRPGVLVFVGMYGKTTSNTTLDRLVAHQFLGN
ncbi:DEAD-like helicases superfamily [Rhizoctonia solani]|uniref:DEAD-like helicases superfamily n=1 Tax=Rhizoctonia solani TaxID=456999 RepID=A0A8H7M063_9AGAM|nr:DEAD-like helicases superfamily [Rhizoctonia solani]